MQQHAAIDLLICDCDGVLIDSEIISHQVVRQRLGEHAPLGELDLVLAGTFGLQSRDIIARVAAHFGLDLPEDFPQQVRAECARRIHDCVQPIPGVREALQAIGLPLAIASNSHQEAVEHALRVTGISDRVTSGVFTAEQVPRPKPAPDVYQLAARRNAVDPGRCLVVEDSATGATAALTAGMQVIGFLGASHIPPEHDEILRELGVRHRIHHMSELPALVESLSRGLD